MQPHQICRPTARQSSWCAPVDGPPILLREQRWTPSLSDIFSSFLPLLSARFHLFNWSSIFVSKLKAGIWWERLWGNWIRQWKMVKDRAVIQHVSTLSDLKTGSRLAVAYGSFGYHSIKARLLYVEEDELNNWIHKHMPLPSSIHLRVRPLQPYLVWYRNSSMWWLLFDR